MNQIFSKGSLYCENRNSRYCPATSWVATRPKFTQFLKFAAYFLSNEPLASDPRSNFALRCFTKSEMLITISTTFTWLKIANGDDAMGVRHVFKRVLCFKGGRIEFKVSRIEASINVEKRSTNQIKVLLAGLVINQFEFK